jgi:hypothetical protein
MAARGGYWPISKSLSALRKGGQRLFHESPSVEFHLSPRRPISRTQASGSPALGQATLEKTEFSDGTNFKRKLGLLQ